MLDGLVAMSHLRSYSGMSPKVHSSRGHTRPDVNHLANKGMYAETANVFMMHKGRHPKRHVSQLYAKVKSQRWRRERAHESEEV